MDLSCSLVSPLPPRSVLNSRLPVRRQASHETHHTDSFVIRCAGCFGARLGQGQAGEVAAASRMGHRQARWPLRRNLRRLPVAEAGYIAVAPDLLSGMGPNGGRSSDFSQGKATEAVSHLNPDQVTADLNAAADYGKKLPASNGKLFVTGYCWGGGQSFRFATNRGDLAAAFVFYGPPPDKDAMARIKAPVYGFYAGDDARIGATLPETIQNMKAVGKTFEPVTYEGAGHRFMRAGEAPDASQANRKARTEAR